MAESPPSPRFLERVVGARCRALVGENNTVTTYAHEIDGYNETDFGSTFCSGLGEDESPTVKVKPPFLFEFNGLGKGARTGAVPSVTSSGHPLPQSPLK